ncbi:MAG: TonB-dependent receptor [Ginsengibacter sp.]
MKKGILCFAFASSTCILNAQTTPGSDFNGRLTGKTIDSSSGHALEYATISVFFQGEKKPVSGTTSDVSGQFTIKELAKGSYTVVIEFIGYQPHTFNNIGIDGKTPTVNLSTISLVKKSNLLQTVTVSLPGKIIENRIDKLIFNAEKDLTSQGGVATDILKKVPQVSVDVDGNVQLAGSSSIRFLIDGKPSSAFGNNITDVLQSIPASQIKSIEVVTNPGAKYDAQGLGGIINIILKKNNARGINGNISLTAGTRLENGAFNFNVRDGNFGMSAFVSGNSKIASNTPVTYDRLSHNASDSTTDLLHQDGLSRFHRHGIETGLGFDWTYKKKNSFSGSLNYNEFGNTGTGHTSQSQVTTLDDGSGSVLSDIAVVNNTRSSFIFHNVDAGLNYKRTFDKEDRELEIAVNSSFGNDHAKSGNNQFLLPQDSLSYARNNINPGKENGTEFTIDFTEPLRKNVTLGVGTKIHFDDINSTSNVFSLQTGKAFLFDSSLSNYLKYHQKVYAAYVELSFPVGKLFDAKVGGRYERTQMNTFYSNAQVQARSSGYNTFVPSIFLMKKLGDNQTIKLSYSKRIQRPEYSDLNPFVNTSDPKNISSGNPFLTPQIGNRYELSYSRDLGATGFFVVSIFYRGSNNDIQPYIVYYPSLVIGDSIYTNVSVSTRQNIGLEKNMGASLFGNINFTKKLSVRSNFFVFHRNTINKLDPGYNSKSFNYRFNVNTNYQFNKTLTGEFFGNFSSARHEAQGSYPSFTTYSIALRQQIWKKKGSIALTAVNPFNEYIKQKTLLYGPGFSVTSVRRIPYRSFGINFTWKFGKLEFKKNKEENSGNINPPSE